MNYRNKKMYNAFMESICKEFKCMQALPALKDGFKALCEAEGAGVFPGDSQLFLYDQENFYTETPFDELTEEEVCKHLTCWNPMTLKKDAAEEMMQEAKSCDGIDNQRVIVSEPDRCIVVRDCNSLANNGMHKYFVRGMKFEDEDAYKDYDERRLFGEYLGFGKDRDPRLNPKPPAGWADKYRKEKENARRQAMLEDDDLESRRRFGEYLGFGKDRDPRLNPKPPKGWQG